MRFFALLTGLVILLPSCSPLIVGGTVAGIGATIVQDRRTFEDVIRDQGIEMRATDSIYSDSVLGKRVNIQVSSFNSIVLLSGEAPTAEMREHAGNMVYALRNVREVYNEIRIAKPRSLASRTRDTWITSKVKASIIADKGLFARTKVVTSDGIVYLMGIVTPEEARDTKDAADSLAGVKEVIPLFEPIDSALNDVVRASATKLRKAPKAADSDDPFLRNDEDDIKLIPHSLPPPIQANIE